MQRRTVVAVIFTLAFIPSFTFAKNSSHPGYERAQGKKIEVASPLGWRASASLSQRSHISLESLPGMLVARVKPYDSWWHFWGGLPATTTLTLSGLPASTQLHIYTRGYRDHDIATSTPTGTLELKLNSKTGAQFIVKEKPSTWHINSDPIFSVPGGDCASIGTWNAITKTCKLSGDVYQTISIDSSNVTLDGNGKSVRGDGTGDGIYTDESGVKIVNVEVHKYARAIVYSDSFFTLANGGEVRGVTLGDNTKGLVNEGVSDLKLTQSHIVGHTVGVSLVDQLDGHATENIELIRNNFKRNDTDIVNDDTSFSLDNEAERGNWWEKNTSCTQDPTNPDECTNAYTLSVGKDNAPWACESAWQTGVTCPFDTAPPVELGNLENGGWVIISSATGVARIYMDSTMNDARVHKILPNDWVLKVIDGAGMNVKVEDTTDGVMGWVPRAHLTESTLSQDELGWRARADQDTSTKRKTILREAVTHYFNNTSVTNSLYSSDDQGSLVKNRLSSLLTLEFTKEVILATSAWEANSTFDNSFVAYDYGHGLKQITFAGWYNEPSSYAKNNWDNRGVASRVQIPRCQSKASNEYYKCYEGAGDKTIASKPYKQYNDVATEPLYKQYANSAQSIYSNVKDGMSLLASNRLAAEKHIGKPEINWASTTDSTLVINDTEFKMAVALTSYNRGSAARCQPGSNPSNPRYLANIAKELKNINMTFDGLGFSDTQDIADKLTLIADNQTEIRLCSPAYLEIVGSTGNLVGYRSNTYLHELPRVSYDQITREQADILLSADSYSYRVVGLESGTYTLYADNFIKGVVTTLSATAIPTTAGAVHEYTPNWAKHTVEIRIDSDGNGTFERTIKSDLSVANQDIQTHKEKKVMLCHRPQGNQGNAHTITVGESALKAHLAHGDTQGDCPVSPVPSMNKDKINEEGKYKEATEKGRTESEKRDDVTDSSKSSKSKKK